MHINPGGPCPPGQRCQIRNRSYPRLFAFPSSFTFSSPSLSPFTSHFHHQHSSSIARCAILKGFSLVPARSTSSVSFDRANSPSAFPTPPTTLLTRSTITVRTLQIYIWCETIRVTQLRSRDCFSFFDSTFFVDTILLKRCLVIYTRQLGQLKGSFKYLTPT
ncbi:hypothetical protein VN97_g7062 [Penicillium thymicola]|uniref:Uncharacterized protein n=1 Tax=Penicillium thymicola TaxID=293382 RepID=A0AAI9X765_PENTH|nr:hypothetical protein VN97_g7062 [Penicillium thymicola]